MAPENLLTNFFGLVIVQMDPAPVQSKDFDPGSGPGHWFRFCLWLRCGACSWWRKHVCRPFCLECEIKPEMLKYAAWLWLSSRPHPPMPPSPAFRLICIVLDGCWRWLVSTGGQRATLNVNGHMSKDSLWPNLNKIQNSFAPTGSCCNCASGQSVSWLSGLKD